MDAYIYIRNLYAPVYFRPGVLDNGFQKRKGQEGHGGHIAVYFLSKILNDFVATVLLYRKYETI